MIPAGSGGDSVKRITHLRWWMIGVGTILVSAGHAVQLVQASFLAIGLAFAAVLTTHLALDAINRSGRAGPWLELVAATLDIASAAVLVLFFGPGALAVALLAAVFPHFSHMPAGRRGPATLMTGGTYLVAATLHRELYTSAGPTWWMPPAAVLLETAVVAAVTWVLADTSTKLRNRIQRMETKLASTGLSSADEGTNRIGADALDWFELSLNRSVDVLTRSKLELSQLAHKAEALAEKLNVLAWSLVDSGRQLTMITQQVSSTAEGSHRAAEAGLAESQATAQGADELTSATAAATAALDVLYSEAGAAHRVLGTAIEAGRETVTRLHYAATATRELGGVAKQIDNRAQQLLKVARQTHVLALNAAIEAAREDKRGGGFAVIAEQVRELAEDARRATREVADLVGQMSSRADTVTGEIGASIERADSTGAATSEANAIAGRLRNRVLTMLDQLKDATNSAERHAQRLQSLIELLSASVVASEDCCREAGSAADLTEAHMQGSPAVTHTIEELLRLFGKSPQATAADSPRPVQGD